VRARHLYFPLVFSEAIRMRLVRVASSSTTALPSAIPMTPPTCSQISNLLLVVFFPDSWASE